MFLLCSMMPFILSFGINPVILFCSFIRNHSCWFFLVVPGLFTFLLYPIKSSCNSLLSKNLQSNNFQQQTTSQTTSSYITISIEGSSHISHSICQTLLQLRMTWLVSHRACSPIKPAPLWQFCKMNIFSIRTFSWKSKDTIFYECKFIEITCRPSTKSSSTVLYTRTYDTYCISCIAQKVPYCNVQ